MRFPRERSPKMAKKSRPATEAGMILIRGVSLGREKIYPMHEWRQAIRTGLNWYWGGEDWVAITIQSGDDNKGRKVQLVFQRHPDCIIKAWFTELCSYGISHTASEVLDVTSVNAEHVAAQLARFSWNRKIKVLQLPVIKADASFDIPHNKVVLAQMSGGELVICRGVAPIMMSE